MGAPRTPGKRLRAQLDKALAPGTECDDCELVVLSLIEKAADRVAVLERLFDAAVAEDSSSRRVVELGGEIRQNHAAIARWVEALDPDMSRRPKSRQHQEAAYSRWRSGSAG